jgi:hypothetical protein
MKISAWTVLLVLAIVPGLRAQPLTRSCMDLTSLKLPHVTITETRLVAAGSGGVPAYCEILGAARPTSDSDIHFEVMIPAGSAWNGRYLQVGNGGFAGTIPERSMIPALAEGYAVAGTDDGHQSTVDTDASWALKHPQKQIDFGYRAIKETTDAAKAVIHAFRGANPVFSYFQGCSDGGREALMEAQRYPGDFNGIVAGDPANHWTHLLAGAVWDFQALIQTPGSYLSPAKLKLVEAEAIKQCGDEDGVIEDPLSCHFQPEKIRCASGDATSCLTDSQIKALRKIYDGPKDPHTGQQIIAGFSPGGEGEENGWTRWIAGPTPDGKQALIYQFASNFFGYVVAARADIDLSKFDFDRDIASTDGRFAPIFNSYDPDLSAFRNHGGKLIQYHGWADPAIPALDSIDYYSRVQAKMGPTAGFYRLFMAPGMLHCSGGPGPNIISTLPAISAWVEHGKAPEILVAAKYRDNNPTQAIERMRPLCAFPARAEWDGKGDKTKMESFRCVASR